VLLVDVPVKSLSVDSAPEVIWYLPEELIGIHARQLGPLPTIRNITVDLSDTVFDLRVGKIRVLVAPDCSTISRATFLQNRRGWPGLHPAPESRSSRRSEGIGELRVFRVDWSHSTLTGG